MSYTAKGIISKIEDEQEFSSGFKKQEFVVTTDEKFPQPLKFELTKDKIELLKSLKVGDEVEVDFNIRGNEYKDRFYVNLQAWRLKKQESVLENPIDDYVDNIRVQNEAEKSFEDVPF